ncbi:DUF943 family protein [Dryocola clanedunensis]|uniref:DUF943 family protein n=1 Tax=Cedecea sulfonylureivorans TaxID=3051154 RepID=UPI00192941DC|nr:DUF943 family protein [Cedecea sulfonylureivorans]
MKTNNRKILYALFLSGSCLSGYLLWFLLRPVDIIAVHHSENSFTSVLIRHYPFTDKGKIQWWLENQGRLKEKYGIPKTDNDGFFEVIFWDFGEGYKETDGYDRLCFTDMRPSLNCIEKNKVFAVWNNKNKDIFLGVDDGFYRIDENGKMVKTKYK